MHDGGLGLVQVRYASLKREKDGLSERLAQLADPMVVR
jgi:hypothetical protein